MSTDKQVIPPFLLFSKELSCHIYVKLFWGLYFLLPFGFFRVTSIILAAFAFPFLSNFYNLISFTYKKENSTFIDLDYSVVSALNVQFFFYFWIYSVFLCLVS